jgi:5'-nucleotidase/UDP-sugar diphosphatase
MSKHYSGRQRFIILAFLLASLQTSFSFASNSQLTILHTNDWQSRLLGFGTNADFTPQTINDDNTLGGVSRLATLIEQRRKILGKDNVLLLDGGDYSMGTLFHTIIRETGAELQLMSALQYDAITFGNHEFDYRPDGLAQSIQSALNARGRLPPIVISNMHFSPDDPADDRLQALWQQNIIRPYVVVNKGGKRVGLFGLMGSDAADVAPNASPISFSDPLEAAKRMVQILTEKEKVDLVVVLSHGGIHQDLDAPLNWWGEDVDLLTQVPGIDIVVGGHSHTPLKNPIMIDDRMILQAGSEAQYLGELSLKLEASKFKKSGYQLHNIDDHIIGDPAFISKIEQFKQQVTELFLKPAGYKFEQVLAHTRRRLGREHFDNVIANLVTDSMKTATSSDIAISTNGPIRDDIYLGSNGIQQVSDLFRIVPLGVGVNSDQPGYDLVKVWITGSEIKSIIEALLLGQQTRGDSFYPRFSGFQVVYNSARLPFDQVSQIKLGDSKNGYHDIDLSADNPQLYSMAANSFVGSMAWLIEKISYGLLEFTPKNKHGDPIANLSEGVYDSNLNQPGIQEIKEWRAFFSHLKKLPDTNRDGVVELPIKAETRLIQIHSYNPVDLYQNTTWIMIIGSTLMILALVIILLLSVRYYRWYIKRNQSPI